MSLVTYDIQGAIYKRFADTAALNTLTATTTSLFFDDADRSPNMPYIVATIMVPTPIYSFGGLTRPREEIRVSFSVFDDSRTAATIDNICDKIEDAYGVNGSALTFEDATYTHLGSFRILGPNRLPTGQGTRGKVIDYRVYLKKAA